MYDSDINQEYFIEFLTGLVFKRILESNNYADIFDIDIKIKTKMLYYDIKDEEYKYYDIFNYISYILRNNADKLSKDDKEYYSINDNYIRDFKIKLYLNKN